MTEDGAVVAGESGPIKLGPGAISIDTDGTVRAGSTVAGRLQMVDFPDYEQLTREGGARFRAKDPSAAVASTGLLRSGALEKSNVAMVERIAEMTEVSRIFEALQKGVTVLMNDIDGKAISELGRR